VPRRPPLRRALLAAAGLLAAGACTSSPAPRPAATGPVAVPVPSASAPLVVSACKNLLGSLPQQLDKGVERRPVTGDPARTAAWGDPAITLQCGVALPDQTATPLVVDDLAFVTTQRAGRVTYTTQGRAVNVSLVVPTPYENQALLVLPLVKPIEKALPLPAPAPGA
jgi:hypothetical protein